VKKLSLYLILILFLLSLSVQAEIKVGSFPQNVEDQYSKELDGVDVEVWQNNLNVPWELIFLSESSRALITERDGKIIQVIDGEIQDKLYLELDINARGEGGLMGTAQHPDFPEKPYIYLIYSYQENGEIFNRVSRFKDMGDHANSEKIIIDKIPGGRNHNGGRIAFGPDKMLYITTGDSWNREIAQDLNSLGGKILRINAMGEIPEDNPYDNSPVYSLGHRNPQGLAWHPETGDLFISDHGPSGEDGLRAKDRIKVVKPGNNFGWPNKIGHFENEEYANPLIMWEKATPPSGITFYQGSLFVATLRSQSLVKIDLGYDENKFHVKKIEHLFRDKNGNSTYGRIRTAVVGPDGYLYFLTNNRDGRGSPRPGDDKILRIKIEK